MTCSWSSHHCHHHSCYRLYSQGHTSTKDMARSTVNILHVYLVSQSTALDAEILAVRKGFPKDGFWFSRLVFLVLYALSFYSQQSSLCICYSCPCLCSSLLYQSVLMFPGCFLSGVFPNSNAQDISLPSSARALQKHIMPSPSPFIITVSYRKTYNY